jgi:chemotaxis protein methyltransferase CheR
VRILGTDVSESSIERAKLGVYERAEVNRGLPIAMLMKYFEQMDGTHWSVNPATRANVRFLTLRLDQPWDGFPVFDLILLRNVLPYFAPAVRSGLLDQARRQLAPDGAMFLGATEQYALPEGLEEVAAAKGRYYRHPAP